MPLWTDCLSATAARWANARVLDFGEPAAERLALEQHSVLVPLTGISAWRISGADAASFLQAQTTNDVAALLPEHWQRSGYCNPKGRLLATFQLVHRAPEDFLAVLPADVAQAVFTRLLRYVLRAKIKLAPESLALMGVAGPLATQVLTRAGLPCPLPGRFLVAAGLGVMGLASERYQILTTPENLPSLWSSLSALARPAGEALWDALDIAAGLATVLSQTQELFVPQMLNFDLIAGLSYTKGCYPGQEIVARMHYLGRLKERLYRACVEAPQPAPGDRLFSSAFGEQACGTVMLAAPGETGVTELLAVMQVAAANRGDVRLGAPEGPRLQFLPLPYAMPEAAQSTT